MSKYPPYGINLPTGGNTSSTDPPLPPTAPTIGMKLNHLCLRVRDLQKSLHFYVNLMGMRTVFVTNTGPMTVYFLGYPQTDRHREHLDEFARETSIPHTEGLLELFHIHGSEEQPEGYYHPGNTAPYLGFSHLGFSVPDLPATVARLQENGVKVFKNVGDADSKHIPISDWEKEHGIGVEKEGTETEMHPIFKQVFANFVYVLDPDGYFVELLPQALPS